MKTIIKSLVLVSVISFTAAKANAQLSSERPAMTPAQVATIKQAQAEKFPVVAPSIEAVGKIVALPVSSSNNIKSITTPVAEKTASSEAAVDAPGVIMPAVKVPVVSMQGEKAQLPKKEQQ